MSGIQTHITQKKIYQGKIQKYLYPKYFIDISLFKNIALTNVENIFYK
jgi:hypothetical protein